AIEFYRKVEADRPGTVDAMSAPIRLYERTEDYAEVVALLEKRADRAQSTARAELFHRAAELTRVQLVDLDRAVALLDSALAADATHVPSLVTLAEIYRERGKLSTADRLLERAVAATAHPLQRTRLYVRRAELRQALDDADGAIALYGAALELDPDDHDAATAAIALLERAGRTTELRPLVERLAATEGDVERRVDRWLQLAQLDEELGAPEQALRAIDRALMLAPGRLSTVHKRGALLFRLGRFADAHIALGSLVDDLGALGVDEVELRWQLGRCALALGLKRDAHLHFSCALALDPQHKPSRAAQIELDREHPSALIDHQRALLAAAAPSERPALWAAIGDLYASLSDPDQALEAYRQALALAPDDTRLLHKCLDTLVAQKEWPATLPLLDRLIALAPPGARRGRYLEAAGLITYDEIDRPDAAVPLLSRALEDDATLDRAADALEELWTQRHDWTALANLHGLRLQRLGPACHDGEQAVRGRLWSKLGDLCLNRLGDRDSALAALEAAARFDPYDLERHRLLAALYSQTPGKQPAAIAEHQLVVANSGGELESYAALEQLYRRSGQPLRSAACGTSLNFLEQRRDAAHADDVTDLATLDDASAADEQPLPRAAAALTPQLWARLQHRDEDRHLSALFALLTPFLMTDQAQAHRQLGLDKKDQVAGNDPRTFARVMQYVARTLGVPAPDAFVRYDQPTAAQFVSCLHQQRLMATLIIGKPLLGTRRSERELAFYLAQQLSYLRPGRIVRWLAPDPVRLLRLVEVSLALAANEPLDGERAATALQVKASLTPLGFDQLLTLAEPLRAYGSELELRIRCWMRATDLTAMRAALLIVGDVELCARLGELDTSLADRRVLHLAAANISDAMFAAREHLKLLQPPAQPRRLRSRRPQLAKVKFL
ncbi:MAG TPA: tetratricopeptide repeat protein, partial [Polyangia bacterium]|nr:tetratricopeptide repeat protein [Polyangia bacterium]